MENRLQQRSGELARQLALEEQERLQAAGTLVDLEQLAADIGDELARQFPSQELSQRANVTAEISEHAYPNCGKLCSIQQELEPVILQGLRGDLEYQEPRFIAPAVGPPALARTAIKAIPRTLGNGCRRLISLRGSSSVSK